MQKVHFECCLWRNADGEKPTSSRAVVFNNLRVQGKVVGELLYSVHVV